MRPAAIPMRSHSDWAAVVVDGEGLTMRQRGRTFVAVVQPLLVMGAAVAAPHGDAAYGDKTMEMKGCVVTEFDWMNPHSLIKFDYKTATGEVQKWTMEIGSPPSMVLLGWSRTTLRAGDVITAYVYQAKSGVKVGRTNKVILADGTVLADRDDS